MKRPTGSNADEWQLFLLYWLNDLPSRLDGNIQFLAVQIAEAIDDQARRSEDNCNAQLETMQRTLSP